MTEDQLNKLLDRHYTKMFSEITRYFDQQFDSLAARLDRRTDNLQRVLDAVVRRMDDDATERAAVIVQLERHEGWIRQIAAKTGTEKSLKY